MSREFDKIVPHSRDAALFEDRYDPVRIATFKLNFALGTLYSRVGLQIVDQVVDFIIVGPPEYRNLWPAVIEKVMATSSTQLGKLTSVAEQLLQAIQELEGANTVCALDLDITTVSEWFHTKVTPHVKEFSEQLSLLLKLEDTFKRAIDHVLSTKLKELDGFKHLIGKWLKTDDPRPDHSHAWNPMENFVQRFRQRVVDFIEKQNQFTATEFGTFGNFKLDQLLEYVSERTVSGGTSFCNSCRDVYLQDQELLTPVLLIAFANDLESIADSYRKRLSYDGELSKEFSNPFKVDDLTFKEIAHLISSFPLVSISISARGAPVFSLRCSQREISQVERTESDLQSILNLWSGIFDLIGVKAELTKADEINSKSIALNITLSFENQLSESENTETLSFVSSQLSCTQSPNTNLTRLAKTISSAIPLKSSLNHPFAVFGKNSDFVNQQLSNHELRKAIVAIVDADPSFDLVVVHNSPDLYCCQDIFDESTGTVSLLDTSPDIDYRLKVENISTVCFLRSAETVTSLRKMTAFTLQQRVEKLKVLSKFENSNWMQIPELPFETDHFKPLVFDIKALCCSEILTKICQMSKANKIHSSKIGEFAIREANFLDSVEVAIKDSTLYYPKQMTRPTVQFSTPGWTLKDSVIYSDRPEIVITTEDGRLITSGSYTRDGKFTCSSYKVDDILCIAHVFGEAFQLYNRSDRLVDRLKLLEELQSSQGIIDDTGEISHFYALFLERFHPFKGVMADTVVLHNYLWRYMKSRLIKIENKDETPSNQIRLYSGQFH
jgi:hypothetical protein